MSSTVWPGATDGALPTSAAYSGCPVSICDWAMAPSASDVAWRALLAMDDAGNTCQGDVALTDGRAACDGRDGRDDRIRAGDGIQGMQETECGHADADHGGDSRKLRASPSSPQRGGGERGPWRCVDILHTAMVGEGGRGRKPNGHCGLHPPVSSPFVHETCPEIGNRNDRNKSGRIGIRTEGTSQLLSVR